MTLDQNTSLQTYFLTCKIRSANQKERTRRAVCGWLTCSDTDEDRAKGELGQLSQVAMVPAPGCTCRDGS